MQIFPGIEISAFWHLLFVGLSVVAAIAQALQTVASLPTKPRGRIGMIVMQRKLDSRVRVEVADAQPMVAIFGYDSDGSSSPDRKFRPTIGFPGDAEILLTRTMVTARCRPSTLL